MARSRKNADTASDQVGSNGATDYRPGDVGRITWMLKLAERESAKELDYELRHTGLTKSQFGVLQALIRLERASSAALARTVFVTPQAMVGIVAGLEKKGYIKRKTSQSSARMIEATVTASGREAYQRAAAMLHKVDTMIEEEFSAAELDQFAAYMQRLIGALQRRGSRAAVE